MTVLAYRAFDEFYLQFSHHLAQKIKLFKETIVQEFKFKSTSTGVKKTTSQEVKIKAIEKLYFQIT